MTTLETSNQEIISISNDRVIPTDQRFLDREFATENQLNKLGVELKYREFVRILDTQREQNLGKDFVENSEQTLYLLHYLTVVDSQGMIDQEILSHVGHVRGIILDQDNNIVCRSFGFTPEYSLSQFQDVENIQDYEAFVAYEGTVLRLFWWVNRWILSTHRKIDASNSYWMGPTFGEMFSETFKENEENLDKNSCYVYILQHPKNRAVFNVVKAILPEVAIYHRDTTTFEITQKTKIDLKNMNLQEFMDSSARSKISNKAGIILFGDNPYSPVKIMSDFYLKLREIRGNEPSLRNRYLRNLNDPDALKLLLDNYPEFDFKKVEAQITELCKKLHKDYIIRFIKKSKQQMPKEEHVTLMRCHTWYNEDRENNIVRLESVKNIVKTTPPKFLIAMLNRL